MKRQSETILEFLKNHLDRARYKHTLGTAAIVEELAKRYGVPLQKAVVAALLHDAGKRYSRIEMISYVKKHNVKVPEKNSVIKFNPSLLHSYISADIAKRKFNVTDRGLLAAIELHTVGGPAMSTLSKILYVSDSIAPDRRHPAVKTLRRLALKDLDRALQAAMANKMYYVIRKGGWLHPEAVKAWNFMVNKAG